jgi:hypothetical protein
MNTGLFGVGTIAPVEKYDFSSNSNTQDALRVRNNNTGTNAVAILRVASDAATVNFQAHGSGRTLTRFGVTMGGWGEFLAVSGSGFAIGTFTTAPLILGVNSAMVMQLPTTLRVGINIAAPTHKLHLNATEFDGDGIFIEGNATNPDPTVYLKSTGANTVKTWTIQVRGGANGNFVIGNADTPNDAITITPVGDLSLSGPQVQAISNATPTHRITITVNGTAYYFFARNTNT